MYESSNPFDPPLHYHPDCSMKTLALQVADLGWRVLPLKPREKKPPLLEEWQLRASRAAQLIDIWWGKTPNANVGLRTGRYGDIWLTIIDIDHDHDGQLWLQEHQGLFNPTFVVKSGSNEGGKHFWYWTHREYRNSQGVIAPGVDIRGEGGYVLPPGAWHPDGNRYSVGCGLPIATMSAALEALIAPPPRRVVNVSNTPTAAHDDLPSVQTILDKYLPLGIVGQRDTNGLQLARQLIANHHDNSEGLDALYKYADAVDRPNDHWDRRDADRVWSSAHKMTLLDPWPAKRVSGRYTR